MAQQTINIGASPNDGTGTPLRTAFQYTNSNFSELYTALGGGSGLPGSSGQVIFNDGGTNLAGDTGLTFNKTTDTLGTGRLTTSGDAIVCSSTGDFYVGTTLSPQFKVERATGSATITGDLTVRTNQLKVDSVGVGVGTTDTTTGKLCVNTGDGTVCFRNFSLILGSGTGAGLDFLNAARSAVVDGGMRATNLTLNSFGANPLILQTNSTERMRIDSSGNVGIGVTPSAWAAGFKVIQASTGVAISTNSVVDRCDISANYYFNAGNKFLNATGRASNFSQDGGAFYFYQSTGTSGGVGSAITWGPGMTLNASGNLLVGSTSNPAYDGFRGFFYNNGNNTLISQCDSANYCLLLYTGNGTNVGSAAAFKYGSTTVGTIQTTASSTAYNTSSDYRLKESVQAMTGALNRIAALKPSTYKWKVDCSSGEGFIAHELAEVVPLAVTGEKDAVNEDGSIKAQGVDLSKVVPVLVAAIQELAAEVNALKNA